MLQVDLSLSKAKLCEEQWQKVQKAHELLESGEGRGSEYLGWLRLPFMPEKEIERIKAAARKIAEDSQLLVVAGIGGSYLGMKAALDMISSPDYNSLPKNTPDILFAGDSLSAPAARRLLDRLEGRDFSLNVISKSGSTMETAIAFRLLREKAEKRYGKEAAKRIYATTDRKTGALKAMADKEGYSCFEIPSDVGGRYSVLSAVGLLPMAVAGIDIDAVLRGARAAAEKFSEKSGKNPAWQYAAARSLLYSEGKKIEIFAAYEPALRSFSEWWKQLFGESEGKQGRGIFPASVSFTTDLHSMGQYIQQGERSLMETVVSVRDPGAYVAVPFLKDDSDGLNYLAGKSLDYVNKAATKAAVKAHTDGGVPCIQIEIDNLGEESFGELVYFFELACALSGYMGGVDPFDQPGVEEYKKNMRQILKI